MNILVAGTFDILHPGHIYLFNEASKIGTVYAVVARDETVKKIKGRYPVFNEQERLLIVDALKSVHKTVLGDKSDRVRPIREISPDIIFLGPDQDDGWIKDAIEKEHLDIQILRLEKRLNYASSWTKEIIKRIYQYEESK